MTGKYEAAVSALAAALKRHGSRSKTAQRMLRLQAERGSTQAAVEALAQALLYEGTAAGLIPRAAGTRTKELADRAEAAILEAVQSYHGNGGVLLAKSYVEPLQLVAEMAKQWISSFNPTIPPTIDLSENVEVNNRLAITAQLVGLVLLEASGRLGAVDLDLSPQNRPDALHYLESLASDPFDLDLTISDLEGLCKRLARVMFETFQMSDEAAHAALHGEIPDGDDEDTVG